jgi:AcrR family transcriptional regulator
VVDARSAGRRTGARGGGRQSGGEYARDRFAPHDLVPLLATDRTRPRQRIIEHAHFSVKPPAVRRLAFHRRAGTIRKAARFPSRLMTVMKPHALFPANASQRTRRGAFVSSLIDEKVFGLRERNKLDKLRRIKDAASELFTSKGFDDTTTREIAVRAGVGLGTLFVYAPTKRDLLFLIVNDELQEVAERAAGLMRPERPMLENLLRIFRAHYRYFAQRPALSRLALREMLFYATGPQAKKYLKTRERLIGLVGDIVDMAIEQELIAPAEDSRTVAWVIFSIYQIEIRHWLSADELNLQRGLNALCAASSSC